MTVHQKSSEERSWNIILTLVLWTAVALLLLPFLNLEKINPLNAKMYLYRGLFGIAIMLIFFGKTLFDLLFPQYARTRMSRVNALLLTLYTLAIAGGLIFMVIRMVVVYIESRKTGFIF
jgi:hypothetical protein